MNLQKMMKQAQALQTKMGQIKAEIESREIEGVAGGGMVKVVMTGGGKALRVVIDPSLMQADERETLEDLVVVAINQAKETIDAVTGSEMGKLTAGLPLPPGFAV